MKPINPQIIKEISDILMFEIDDSQHSIIINEFNDLIAKLNCIADIEGVDDAIPMVFPFDVSNSYLREDICEEPLPQEDVLRNCSNVENGQIKLPRVVK